MSYLKDLNGCIKHLQLNSENYDPLILKLLTDYQKFLKEELPQCLGDGKGSGGHVIWSNNCGKIATWNDDDKDCCGPAPMCDEHFKKIKNESWLKYYIELPYADFVRELNL